MMILKLAIAIQNYGDIITATSLTMETIQACPHTVAEEEPAAYINIIEELHTNSNFTLIVWSGESCQWTRI